MANIVYQDGAETKPVAQYPAAELKIEGTFQHGLPRPLLVCFGRPQLNCRLLPAPCRPGSSIHVASSTKNTLPPVRNSVSMQRHSSGRSASVSGRLCRSKMRDLTDFPAVV